MTKLRLSVIDIYAVARMRTLASALDALGYYRLWNTEHHSLAQSASPILMAGIAAGSSVRLKVGTAGIMIRYSSPFKIAEDFKVLESIYPGRIDLGIIGAPVKNAFLETELLDGRMSNQSTSSKTVKLLTFLVNRNLEAGDLFPGPSCTSSPRFWICSTRRESARVAGQLGVGFFYNQFLGKATSDDPDYGRRILDDYRCAFKPGYHLQPEATVAFYGMCIANKSSKIPWNSNREPDFVGEPEQCGHQIQELAERYEITEVAVQCFGPTFDTRLDAYSSLADAFTLSSEPLKLP